MQGRSRFLRCRVNLLFGGLAHGLSSVAGAARCRQRVVAVGTMWSGNLGHGVQGGAGASGLQPSGSAMPRRVIPSFRREGRGAPEQQLVIEVAEASSGSRCRATLAPGRWPCRASSMQGRRSSPPKKTPRARQAHPALRPGCLSGSRSVRPHICWVISMQENCRSLTNGPAKGKTFPWTFSNPGAARQPHSRAIHAPPLAESPCWCARRSPVCTAGAARRTVCAGCAGMAWSRVWCNWSKVPGSCATGPSARRALPALQQPTGRCWCRGVDLHNDAVHALMQQFRFVPEGAAGRPHDQLRQQQRWRRAPFRQLQTSFCCRRTASAAGASDARRICRCARHSLEDIGRV